MTAVGGLLLGSAGMYKIDRTKFTFVSMVPSSGPISGGTIVSFTAASHFNSDQLKIQVCKELISVTQPENYTKHVFFPVPNVANSCVCDVEVSINQKDFFYSGFQYEYYLPSEVFEILPSSGPIEGNTFISVLGQDLRKNSVLHLSFNDLSMTMRACTVLSSSRILATTPTQSVPRTVFIHVSSDGFERSKTSLQFRYEHLPTIACLNPSHIRGSDLVQIITLQGTHFLGHQR